MLSGSEWSIRLQAGAQTLRGIELKPYEGC
jgi:hypothetical protein